MVGPFKPARGNLTHILVMVDKFTKWVEVKPVRNLDGETVIKFLKDIILRYGYPHSIITDNGTTLPREHSRDFALKRESDLTLCRSQTPKQMGR